MVNPLMVALMSVRQLAELPTVATFCVTEQASPSEW